VRRWILYSWIIGGLVPLLARGQSPWPVLFAHLTTSEGLPHSSVFDQAEDTRGFLWLATGDGLARYDGYDVKVYRNRSGQSEGLSGNHVEKLLVDRRGRLWVGTHGHGLNRMNADGETFRTAWGRGELTLRTIAALTETPDGTIWIGTTENGLWSIDAEDSLQPVPLPDRRTTALTSTPDGTLWVGGHGQVLRRNANGHLTIYPLPYRDSAYAHHNAVSSLYTDRRGRLWAGTRGNGLYVLDSAHMPPEHRPAFRRVLYEPQVYEQRNLITDVCEDRTGRLWIATDAGVWLCPGGDLARRTLLLPDPDQTRSLSTFAAKRLWCDRAGNVWIGTWEGGVNVHFVDASPFQTWGYEPRSTHTLLKPKVAALAATPQGLWIGSIRGLSRLGPDRRMQHFIGLHAGLSSQDVNALIATPQGGLLISTWTRGFDYLSPRGGVLRAFGSRMGRSKSVRAFTAGTGRRIWISTQENQLFRFDESRQELTPIDISGLTRRLGDFSTISLYEDSDGWLWLGTYDSGLIRWNPATGAYGVLSPRTGTLPGGRVLGLMADRQKRLWVAMADGGLAYLSPDRRRLIRLGPDQGLPSHAVVSVLEDDAGRIWAATNGGLSVLNEQTGRFRTFRESDGLLGEEFIPGSAARLLDGTLAFGSTKGLTLFRPEAALRHRPPPRVYLTGLRLFNKPVSPTDPAGPLQVEMPQTAHLTLDHAQSVITLEFTGLALHRPDNVRYAYQLDDVDPDWNVVGTQRTATYTNLSEGTYQFRVRASFGSGPWGPSQLLSLTIRPPWYRTGWAYAGYLLLGLGLAFWFRQTVRGREQLRADIRIQQAEAAQARVLNAAKTSFFTNISHEFRTPLTLILTPLDRLLSQAPDGPYAHQYQLMHRNATRLLRLINQLLDLSKLESGTLVPRLTCQEVMAHVRMIHQSFEGWAEHQRIHLTFRATPEAHTGWFEADFLEKIISNLLANALRFTPEGGEVRLDARLLADERLQLTVVDTGCGIAPEHLPHLFDRFYQAPGQAHAGTGVGLALVRELIELHGGQIRVTSQPLLGTTFCLEIPLRAEAFPAQWLADRVGGEVPVPAPGEWGPGPLPPVPTGPAAEEWPLLLLAEDNDELRQYLSEHFAARYRVVTATDGQTALRKAIELIPDLVVSDWLMPHLGGVDLCRALKTDERTNHVPFLLLTSRSGPQHQLTALEAAPDDYVTKPFNLSVLERKLDNLIQSRQLLREKWNRSFSLGPIARNLPDPDSAFLGKITLLVEQHLDDPTFDVEQLEQALGLSRMQLYRKLRSLTNRSGSEFIRLVRLQRGRDLLETGHFSVKEVAFQVGFNDPAYFSRVFKKEFGVSPQQVVV
jgi:signal transduction histidine kinase/ligand-binding sensor domain-containing protein/DNA-binding response OmpR family regulator